MSKTIFITGASKGFGKIRAEAFLKRGDKVIAVAHSLNNLDDLIHLSSKRKQTAKGRYEDLMRLPELYNMVPKQLIVA